MNLLSLLCLVYLLINYSECASGPDIFKFTTQPASQTITTGGSVTLSCEASRTGGATVTYAWYSFKKDFSTPPIGSDLISGESTTRYVVSAANVDDSSKKNLFQCRAASGKDSIFSDVAAVVFTIQDDIQFSGTSYSESYSPSDDENDADAFVYKMSCYKDKKDLDNLIRNGKPYDVYWFKDSESKRVEETHKNMWTYYNKGTATEDLKVDIADAAERDLVGVKPYDLVIYNAQKTDSGTYYCKAVSKGDKNTVLLKTATLKVTGAINDYSIKSKSIVGGYVVLVVDDTGKRKSVPNVGDEVLLMCGAACRTSGGGWDIQYTWKDGSGTVIPNETKNTIIVTPTSSGSKKYLCEINSECSSSASAKSITFTVLDAEFDPLSKFTFSISPPEYKWYDTSDNSKSDGAFEIDCAGSASSGSFSFIKAVYKNGVIKSTNQTYTFDSKISSEKSGVYQCALYNNPQKMAWHQKTTNIVIATSPTSTVTATSTSIQDGTTATFTCTVAGYPIESVIITGPNSVNLICPKTNGDVNCTTADSEKYTVTVGGFSAAMKGQYICTVKTRWYKTSGGTDMGKTSTDTVTFTYVKASTTTLTVSKTSPQKGDSVTLTCVVVGYPAPSKPTLSKSGSSIDWTTCTGTNRWECTKTFSPAKYSDSGDYKCEGKNTIDSVDKPSHADLNLTIGGDVNATLTQTPNKTALEKGSSVTFICKAEGNTRPTKLTLKKGGQELKSYDAAGGSDADIVTNTYDISYKYTKNPLALEDTATYTCEGENNNGGVKTNVDSKTITVVSDVAVTLSASSTTPTIGSTLTITCTATGGRKPHSVELKRDNVSLKSYPSDSSFCADSGSYSLKCTYSTTTDYTSGGSYKCIGKNNVANWEEVTTTESLKVSVSQQVAVTMTPSSETEVPSGTSFTITCDVKGGDQPHKVTLTKPDKSVLTWEIASSGSKTLTCTGTFQLKCTYEIGNPVYSDEGQYRCDGFNKLPGQTTVQTKDAAVSLVLVKDVDVTLTKSITSSLNEVAYGDPFTITCVADGGRIPFYLEFSQTPSNSATVVYDSKSSKTPSSVTVKQDTNTLKYVRSVTRAEYGHIGNYTCLSKNEAASKAEKNDKKDVEVLVVKDVEITQSKNVEADFGKSFTFTIKVNGGRPPHYLLVTKGNSQIFDKKLCSGTNEMTCTKTVGDGDVNFGYAGTYTVTAKNRAGNEVEKTATKKFTVTVYKDVSAKITPSSDSNIKYHQDKTITCKIEGGLPPHQVDLIFPNQTTTSWKRNEPPKPLNCSGANEMTCRYTFKAEYDSDGLYKCKGYNKARNGDKESESAVTLTTVRETEVNMSEDPISVVTNGNITLDCIIVGKPLVEKSSVSWRHDNASLDLDLSKFVETVDGSEDNYTLKSTLKIDNPPVKYTGKFTCTATNNKGTFSKSVEVIINEREFLNPPEVTHSGGVNIKENYEMSITCLVEGFPRPTASLKYEDINGTLSGSLEPNSTETPSKTSTKFEFKLTTSCEYSQYKFSCDVQNKKTNKELLNQSASVNGPVMIECGGPELAAVIGGGVGGGVFFIIIIVLVVLFILKKARGTKERSYAPQNGTEFPNPAFSPDPSYATINDQARPGYSHLNRPVGATDDCGYSSIEQMKQNAVPVPGDDAYATLDTTSNGRLGHQRKGSDEAYAALNRPAPGKEKRGVIRKYKPIANRPKTVGMPPSLPIAGDFEMGETSHASPAEPTYATVNPDTMKPKAKASNYADITLPDVPPEVPVYGQMSDREPTAAPSEYADVTLPPLPPPPPEEPMYSNMGDRQEPTEDPVYAQVDFKSRTLKQPAAEETEELPPDVPVYGTMGELTVPYNPEEEEDPYATVEFVPKSKRKPPRPKVKEAESEGVYATITDIKENP